MRQPFISRAGIIFIPTTYYHNSWWLAHLSPSFRDFFDAVPEKGRGDNYWSCTPSCVIGRKSSTQRFIDCVRDGDVGCYKLGFVNDLYPQNNYNIDNWVASQCWLLKVHDGSGRTSRILKANAAVFQLFREQFGEITWEDLQTDILDDEINEMELVPCYFCNNVIPSYIEYLFKYHRKKYLLSLLAMSMDKDEPCPENAPMWIRKIWGTAYKDIYRAQKDLPSITNCWKVMINGNARDLVFSYRFKKFRRAYLIQDTNRIELSNSGKVQLATLLEKGFDIHKDLIIKGETNLNGNRTLHIPALRKKATIFRKADKGVQERRLLSSYGRISYTPENRKLYIISAEKRSAIHLTYDNQHVELQDDGRINEDYTCYIATLPISTHPAKSPLVVNDTHIMDLVERPVLILLNSERNTKLDIDNQSVDVIIGNKLRVYVEGNARIHPIQHDEQLIRGNEVEYEIAADNMCKVHTITVQRTNCSLESIGRHFICLPEDWKHHCTRPDVVELYAAARKGKTVYCYTTQEHGILNISVPIDKTYTFWVHNNQSISMGILDATSELDSYKRAEAYSHSRISLEIRYGGKLIDGYPDESSRIYADDLKMDILDKLPRFARRQPFMVSFNNCPVFEVMI